MAFHTGTTSTFDAPDTPAPGLTACPWCDLLQREAVCTTSCVVRCWRCDGIIYRAIPGALDTALALTLAAAALFAIANVFPVMSLDLQGQHVSARLVDIVWSLQREGMAAIGAVVLVTLILTPALQIAARLYLLLPLRLGRTPRALAAASRVLDTMRRWSMVEVFVLAAIVCMHRLRQIADLEIDWGFWALGAVMLLFAATDSIFDARDLWTESARRAA
jgi:paraquat-inducible protein A